jgi:hypothetical protein
MENENTLAVPGNEDTLSSSAEFEKFADAAEAALASPKMTGAAASAPATKTPEEIAAEAEAAKLAAAPAPAAKPPEEIAAEAEAAKLAAAPAPVAKTPEEIAAEAEAAKLAAAPASATKMPEEDPRIAALQAQIDALQPKPVAPAPAEVYTAEEKTFLSEYAENWPDIAKAEALTRRAEYRGLVEYIFQQVEAKYAPALDYTQNRGVQDQYSAIKSLVPDYDAVRDKTLAWVDTQPAWLKAAYTKVASEGTPEEVAGLIGLYKKEQGIAIAPAIAPAIVPAIAPAITPAAKAAAVKLTLVKTGRSESGAGSEDSPEVSFAAYAEEEEKRLFRK